MVVLVGDWLFVVNVGDLRVVICINGEGDYVNFM